MKVEYFYIYQTPLVPFLYAYNEAEELLFSQWILNKSDLNFIYKNYIQKKWIFLEEELNKYFNNNLKVFSIKYNIKLIRPFTQKVLKIISDIPNGSVLSYKQVAQKINGIKAYRAIGQACKANPFPLIIPCHRVVSINGYGGYAGKKDDSIELSIKKKLLQMEGKIL